MLSKKKMNLIQLKMRKKKSGEKHVGALEISSENHI